MDLSSTGLYLIGGKNNCPHRDLLQVVLQAVQGGVDMVQLREKDCSAQEFFQTARQLQNALQPLHIPLIINDRVDIALAVGAQGVHIGQDDLPPEEVRKLLGRNKIIGLSVNTVEQAIVAEKSPVDYLGIGPVFATRTKKDIKPVLGLEGFKDIRRVCSKKTFAIGAVNLENAAEIIKAGADGLALISAICAADNPQASARELSAIIKNQSRNA